MGIPSTGIEAMYRNPAKEVQRLLGERHGEHCKVYNLVSEREPDYDLFPLIEYFPFDDHNACPLELLPPLCTSIHEFLEADPENVVAIHCKAGKGRTGLVISAYLLHAGLCSKAQDALAFFSEKRTDNSKGVTIPSQIRYVGYYEHLLRYGLQGKQPPTCHITRVFLKTIPSFAYLEGGCDIFFKVKVWENKGKSRCLATYWSYKDYHVVKHRGPDEPGTDLDCSHGNLFVNGDVKLVLCHLGHAGKTKEICSMWFNTHFVKPGERLVFSKGEIDKAVKDKKCKHFARGFEVSVELHPIEEHHSMVVTRPDSARISDCESSGQEEDSDVEEPAK